MPQFIQVEPLIGRDRLWRVTYDDSDPNLLVGRVEMSTTDPTLGRNSVSGSGAVEAKLSALLP